MNKKGRKAFQVHVMAEAKAQTEPEKHRAYFGNIQ